MAPQLVSLQITLSILLACVLGTTTGLESCELANASGGHLPQQAQIVASKRESGVKHLTHQDAGKIKVPEMPKSVVKVIISAEAGSITLVGAPEDIAIVKQAVVQLNEQYGRAPSVVTTRIQLRFQLSDTVASILTQSMSVSGTKPANLSVRAIHFPEAILLTGTPRDVGQAREIIKTIDSHDYWSRDKMNKQPEK